MRLDVLDIFKAVPIVGSAYAGEALLKILYPLGYTTQQHTVYMVIGAIVGGLYSISFLGGLAKAGNKSDFIKLAMPLALVWALDAPIIRDIVIKSTIEPKYSIYTKEYLKIPKTENISSLEEKKINLKAKIDEVKIDLKIKKQKEYKQNYSQAEKEYLENYKKYGWWNKISSHIGCKKKDYTLENQEERLRRISCLTNYRIKADIDNSKLDFLVSQYNTIINKINLIKNKNTNIKNREYFLKNKIEEAKNKTFPLWIYYIFMFIVGYVMEIFLPHLKIWRDWKNHQAEKNNKIVGVYVEQKQIEYNEKMIELSNRFFDVLSDKKKALDFILLSVKKQEVDAKINTFFAVARAIKAGEKNLTIAAIQRYSFFINPKTGRKYNTQRYTSSIVFLFKQHNISEQNMTHDNMSKLLLKVKKI